MTVADDRLWCVYLLQCADDTLYAGISCDLPRRLRQHNGELVGGSRYTRSRRPVVLAWSTQAECRAQALRLEAAIKALSRDAKWALIRR